MMKHLAIFKHKLGQTFDIFTIISDKIKPLTTELLLCGV